MTSVKRDRRTLAKQQQRKYTRFPSAEKRINASMELDFFHKDLVSRMSSRLIIIRLRAVPVNITALQACAPASNYDDNETGKMYNQLQNVIDQTPKKDIILVQGDWNAKVSKMLVKSGKAFADPSVVSSTAEKGEKWRKLVVKSSVVPQRPLRLRDR